MNLFEARVTADRGDRLTLADGQRIAATVQNRARTVEPVATADERLWASWAPGDTLILVE